MNASICCCSLLLYVCLVSVGNKLDTCLDKTLGAGYHPKLALILFKLNQEPGKKKKKQEEEEERMAMIMVYSPALRNPMYCIGQVSQPLLL